MEKTVFLDNGHYLIPAVIKVPEGNGPFGAVVMLHGTGSDKDEAGNVYKILANEFAAAGIASIRIDFVGTGQSLEDYSNYNYGTAISDANFSADFISKVENIDRNKLGVMGWSQGGTIALLAAGVNPKFKSVLCWAGAIDLTSLVNEEAYIIAQKNGYYNLEFDWRSPLKLGIEWFQKVYTMDVLEIFSNTDAPVMAINGMKDDVVNPASGQAIAAVSKNNESEFLLIDEADHTFNVFSDMTTINEVVVKTVKWFVRTLNNY